MAAFKLISQVRRITINNSKLINAYCQNNFLSSKILSDPLPPGTDKKKKAAPVQKITLISPDESIQVLSLPDAQKISERRNLKLVKIIDLDTKTQRPVFKLMTSADYLASDLKVREAKKAEKNSTIKGEKILLINSRISPHDLEARINKVIKWIEKRYAVRITISGEEGSMDTCESIYKKIEDELKQTSRLVQKRTKGSDLKFQILPPKQTKEKDNGTKSENDSL